ncbi:hypothetical protein C8Q78DRAFT_1074901 [Trametes maxima]|nr:hypothetical protein C8Q78DRAFT_1074901 [Trametes maxima]
MPVPQQLVAPRRGATSGVDDDVQPVLKKLLRIDEPVTEHDAAFLDRYGFLSPSTPIIQAEALPPVSAPSTRRYLARTPPSKLPVPFDQCAPLPHSEQQPHPRSRDALVDRPQRTLYRNNRGPLDCSSRPWPHVRGCDEVTNAVDSDATTASHPNAGFGESSSGSRRLVIHPLAKGDVGYHPSQPRHPPADPPSHWNKERGAVYAMRSPYMPPRDTIVGASAPAYAPRYAAPPVLIPLRLPERPESTYNTLPPGDLTQPRQDAERRGLDEHSPSTSPTSCSSDIHRGTQYWDFSWPTDEDAPGSKALGRSATISSSHSTPTCGGFSPAPAATLSLVAPFVPPRGRVNAFTRVPRSLSVSEVPCFSSDSSLPPKPVDDDESWPEESTAFLFLPCFTTEGLPIASASPLQVDQRDPDSVPISRYSALDGALIMH